MTDPQERVRSALKKPRQPPPEAGPGPADDVLDDLLGPTPSEGVSAEDINGWKAMPETMHAVKTMRGRYQTLAKALVAGASASTDPRVAAQGARLQELQAAIIALSPRGK